MTTIHRTLTGADLHEPKGADTAVSGQVYVSDGAGSGAWTTATSIITNTAFTTGDVKLTLKTSADTSWILHTEGGTIGDGSSGATIRANADTSTLFAFYWNGFTNTICPVSGGRGGSAAADFAAHKTLTVPAMSGRALTVAGTGSGLTNRALATGYGAETVALSVANIPTLTSTSGGVSVTVNSSATFARADSSAGGAGGSVAGTVGQTVVSTGTTSSISVTSTGTSGSAHSILSPIIGINVMIKL